MAEASIDSSDEDIFQNYAGKKGIKPYRFEPKRRRLNVDQPGNVGSRVAPLTYLRIHTQVFANYKMLITLTMDVLPKPTRDTKFVVQNIYLRSVSVEDEECNKNVKARVKLCDTHINVMQNKRTGSHLSDKHIITPSSLSKVSSSQVQMATNPIGMHHGVRVVKAMFDMWQDSLAGWRQIVMRIPFVQYDLNVYEFFNEKLVIVGRPERVHNCPTYIPERNIKIARGRGLPTESLLKGDDVPSPILFEDGGMMTKPAKSLFLKECESVCFERRCREVTEELWEISDTCYAYNPECRRLLGEGVEAKDQCQEFFRFVNRGYPSHQREFLSQPASNHPGNLATYQAGVGVGVDEDDELYASKKIVKLLNTDGFNRSEHSGDSIWVDSISCIVGGTRWGCAKNTERRPLFLGDSVIRSIKRPKFVSPNCLFGSSEEPVQCQDNVCDQLLYIDCDWTIVLDSDLHDGIKIYAVVTTSKAGHHLWAYYTAIIRYRMV
ncbi:hypothetical protein GQR58_001704 [Nymphon striatum]|nr:hypothetical protein GQR58_001704 [Nymphon striatum]